MYHWIETLIYVHPQQFKYRYEIQKRKTKQNKTKQNKEKQTNKKKEQQTELKK